MTSICDRITKKCEAKKKNKQPRLKGVPIYKLFSYSDWIDKILILVGISCALCSGILFPVGFYFYGQIAAAFIDYESSLLNYTISYNDSIRKCVSEESLNTDYDGRIQSNILRFVGIAFGALIVTYVSNVCFNTAAERQIKRIRQNLFEKILRQNMSFFDKNNPGDLNSLMTSNLETLKGAINFKFSDFITLFSRGIACIIFAIIVSWRFTLPFLTIVPFIVAFLNLMIHYIKKYSIQEFISYGSAGKIAQESLSALKTVLSFGMQRKVIREYSENLHNAETVSLKKGYLKGFFEASSFSLFALIFGIGIYYATYLNRLDCETYTPSKLLSAFFCIVTASQALGMAIPFFSDLGTSKGVAVKLFDMMNTKSSIDIMNIKTTTLDDMKGDISFKGVHFNYPQRPDVKILQGLSLDVPAGKTVAFVGASGCGKSTTIGLLQRFYMPDAGEVMIDGKNIADLNLTWLREQMALVSQEPVLFSLSISENIRLGRLSATDEEIEEAAKNANAHEFIMKLVDKYDTKVGERGTSLSGGQKQRIAIARALIRNPKILLLDEATSALDNESEKIVQDALDRAKIGRTTIVIAHRLTTIRNADLIVAFQDGCVVEKGTHSQLMFAEGIYYDLVSRQTNPKTNVTPSMPVESRQVSSDESDSENEEDLKKKEVMAPITDTQIKDKTVKKYWKPTEKPFHWEMKLLKIQKPELLWIIIGTVSQLINGAIFPGIVLVFTEIYNVFNIEDEAEQRSKSLEYLGIIVALGVVNFIVLFLYNYSFAYAGAKLTKRVREGMFTSMLRQEIAFHDLDENRSSILATQLSTNPPFCKGITSDKIGTLSQGFSGIGFAIVVAFVLNWKLSLIMLLFVPVSFFSGVFAGRSSLGNIKVKGRYSIDEGGRILIESVENIRTVVSLGREMHFIKEMKELFLQGYKKTLLSLHLQAVFYSVSNTLSFFVQLAAFSYGWVLIQNDGLKVADLYKVYATMTFSSMLLGRVYSSLPDQKKARDSTKTAFKIMERLSKIDSIAEEGLKPSDMIGNIEFKNVSFEYPTRPGVKVLQNFNLSIRNGETNALVGQSGCGKSTTISLLLRFYDVMEGSVKIDGIDIRELNIEWLRSKIAIVSQEPVLFDCSIKENILNGNLMNPNLSVDDVIQAAKDSNIQRRIESLPLKYDTNVGQKGSQLSGGEKQRIAIARALIRSPKILLLDEATSALDIQSEKIVQDSLDNAQKGRTCIAIAHRLTTIEKSDKICVIKNGAVAEVGTHDELMALKSLYFKLKCI